MNCEYLDRKELALWVDGHMNGMVRDIVDLVNIPSVSVPQEGPNPFGEGCKKVLDKGLEIASRLGFFTQNHENWCGSALWRGEADEEIGVFGHLDVVPEGTGWNYRPFQATVKDGLIIGRGAADNKGPAIMGLYAVKYLMEMGYQPRHSFRVFLGCNEECGMEDIRHYLRHNPMPKFSLVPDAEFPVCNGEKGILILDISHPVTDIFVQFESGQASNAVPAFAAAVLTLPYDRVSESLAPELGNGVSVEACESGSKITATGISTHAAYPKGSVNAMAKLAGALSRSGLLTGTDQECVTFLSNVFGSYYGEGLGIHFRDETGYVTHIGGMTKVTDGRLSQNINIRYPMGITADELMEKIAMVCGKGGFTVDTIKPDPPTFLPPDHPVVRMLNDLANSMLNTGTPPFPMGFTYARRLENAVAFGPLTLKEESPFGRERGGVHQPDECMPVETLKQAVAIYAQALYKLDQML